MSRFSVLSWQYLSTWCDSWGFLCWAGALLVAIYLGQMYAWEGEIIIRTVHVVGKSGWRQCYCGGTWKGLWKWEDGGAACRLRQFWVLLAAGLSTGPGRGPGRGAGSWARAPETRFIHFAGGWPGGWAARKACRVHSPCRADPLPASWWQRQMLWWGRWIQREQGPQGVKNDGDHGPLSCLVTAGGTWWGTAKLLGAAGW